MSCPSIIPDAGICLVFEDDNALLNHQATIENEIRSAVLAIDKVMPMNDLQIRIVDDPNLIIPEIGIGGYNPNASEVIISIEPEFPNITQVLNSELGPILAHEMHHANRRRAVGYGASLVEAAVSEGLADHFSMEIFGIDPPIWSVALSGQALQDWINIASTTWTEIPYDHRGWFLGTSPDIPRWAGYSIGFDLVKDYLAEHPDRLPSDLFSEPAVSFVP